MRSIGWLDFGVIQVFLALVVREFDDSLYITEDLMSVVTDSLLVRSVVQEGSIPDSERRANLGPGQRVEDLLTQLVKLPVCNLDFLH